MLLGHGQLWRILCHHLPWADDRVSTYANVSGDAAHPSTTHARLLTPLFPLLFFSSLARLLTPRCIVVNGFWGILYYKEIKGFYPVAIFVAAVAVIIVGAILDGSYA